MTKAILLWFRNDLRLEDNPAFWEACQKGIPIIPLFIDSSEEHGDWALGAASRSWLHHSLQSLQASLEKFGLKLILRQGKSSKILDEILEESGAQEVYWNRRYEPALIQNDKNLKEQLGKKSIAVKSFKANLLFEPWEIENKQGKAFQVYTAFWNHCCKQLESIGSAHPLPKQCASPSQWPKSLKLEELHLLPKISWDKNFYSIFQPGEKTAQKRLKDFIDKATHYSTQRDIPSEEGTSRLSPHLHFGEIGPKQIFLELRKLNNDGAQVYLKEIFWREFAHHLLYHFPQTATQPLREEFNRFPWHRNQHALEAWQKGKTGYPIVDAGMRELWTTGWMHNRVRMIVASFLVKDLLIPWQAGARWFWDTLLDADLANNTMGWQWSAGCGADAAPFFRIFNPTLQGEKFDAGGRYVRRWLPELSRLPDRFIHQPWEAPAEILKKAALQLGRDYPFPTVDHGVARKHALEALAKIRK